MTPADARPRVVAGLRLLHLVGQGGEGEVWEARDRTGRRRALKLIRPDSLVTPDEVERRGRWLLHIDHPALVAVHRCGVLRGAGLDGWGFVEMDFVDGPSLDGAEAEPGILDRLEPLAEALDMLHAGLWSDGVPLVHRDVKPANLLEAADGGLVLVDHSTLRDVDDTTRTRIGTPLFAAPEVITGRAGPLADVYAFAATAVALLTGARRADLADLLEVPEELDLPAGLRAALAADPAQRPVSCRAALDPSLPLVVGHDVGWAPRPLDAWADDQPDAWTDGRQDAWADDQPDAWTDGRQDAWADDQVAWADGDRHTSVAPAAAWDAAAAPRPDAYGDAAWLPPASQVMLEPWRDWTGQQPRTSSVWRWVAVLGLLLAAPAVGAMVGVEPRLQWDLGLALGAVHVLAHLLARRRLALAVLLPPVAWAFLLADRVRGRLRPWVRAAALSPVLVGTVAVTAVLAVPDLIAPGVAVGLSALAIAGTAAVMAAAGGGAWGRLLLLPLWLPGALALVAGSVVLVPLGLVVDRAGDLLRLISGTVRGAAAMVRD